MQNEVQMGRHGRKVIELEHVAVVLSFYTTPKDNLQSIRDYIVLLIDIKSTSFIAYSDRLYTCDLRSMIAYI